MEFFGYSRPAALCGGEERNVGLRYLAVMEQYPELKVFFQSPDYITNPAKTALFYLALSGDRTIIKEIVLRVNPSSTCCLVRVNGSATLERGGLTDIFTYGAASCAFWIIDGKTLAHLPLAAEVYHYSNLELYLPFDTPRPKKTLSIIPGDHWTEMDVARLRQAGVSRNFSSRPKVDIGSPGSWVTWLGFRDGKMRCLSYEWKRNTILR